MSEPSVSAAYADDDLVYVDPDRRAVVGIVEFSRNGKAKPMLMEEKPEPKQASGDAKAPPRRFGKPRKRYYPWGTYRTMKKIYRIEGRVPDADRNMPLDEAIDRALKEPFWDA